MSLALRISLVVLSLLGLLAGAAGVMVPLGGSAVVPPAPRYTPRATVPVRTVDSLLRLAIARAPFRVTRRLAAVAYDPSRPLGPGPVISAPPPKPVLRLSGIVWGKETVAVIEGFPGVEGPRVVRWGDVVGELTVKRISPSGVVIAGLDTTWNLTVRIPWQ